MRIDGRLAILLTVHWIESTTMMEPLYLKAVFHSAALQHPPAPPEIQTLVDGLIFTPEA